MTRSARCSATSARTTARRCERHYDQGPPDDWAERIVSAYATMHPWEDWAETFAHYLHIRDTLQTAAAFGMTVAVGGARRRRRDPEAPIARRCVGDWLPLSYALNAMNRSLGHGDLYPYVLTEPVIDKLAFVDERIRALAAPAWPARNTRGMELRPSAAPASRSARSASAR